MGRRRAVRLGKLSDCGHCTVRIKSHGNDLRGDTGFEECLLTADFTEITRNGDIKDLTAELALAAKNKATPLPLGDLPSGQVLLHGNVAVAYGRSQSATGARAMRYADYYVWENAHWRVYFAQQTELSTNP